ncbi:JmjC domain, hydroxylase-domain-containing protein, partial [Mucidula mucida]
PSPNALGWFDPEDDLLATRGIPVFKPTMDEFRDFEGYMNKIECWGMRSGIVKVIPPKEWVDALPPMKEQLEDVKIKTPIEQHIAGTGGHFRQENMEKRKLMSIREWAELCAKDDGGKMRAPRSTRRNKSEESQDEPIHDPASITTDLDADHPKSKKRPKRSDNQAAKHARDSDFLQTFQPHIDWLPPGTTSDDYTPEFCQELARQFWRNCGLGKPAWYGADSQGSSLFTPETEAWNVAHLESALTRLLPSSDQGLPGVNTPYLYWGMWRATFAWHVEDMDLFSINYIHFGAPKFWYAIPQGRAKAFEQVMNGYFPTDGNRCNQFLRHKQFLVSPGRLAKDSMSPNHCVQQAGEFIITYPRGYHAGFNLGLNCAESVNFALDSWISLGRRAKACQCIPDSVRIDVDQLLRDHQAEAGMPIYEEEPEAVPMYERARSSSKKPAFLSPKKAKTSPPSKSKASTSKSTSTAPKIMLKIGPRPELEHYPCCLCVATSTEGLLRVMDPPYQRKEALEAAGNPAQWLAHRTCADVVPETWVDELELEDGSKESVIYGVDGIVKDRWNLKCAACAKARSKAHGAPIQCTKGKCSKAFHVSCARSGQEQGIKFDVLREVEKDVVLFDPVVDPMQVDSTLGGPEPNSTVVKVIKKVEVQVLCMQHNPDVTAAKKASKLDKIRRELLALPQYSPIKIRVSSGVFEVPLNRVIEETSSVEVIWDKDSRGGYLKRELKWGSVIMGNTEGMVVHKRSEIPPRPPPDPQRVSPPQPTPVASPHPQVPHPTHPPSPMQQSPQSSSPQSTSSESPPRTRTFENLKKDLQKLIELAPERVDAFLEEHPHMRELVLQAIQGAGDVS